MAYMKSKQSKSVLKVRQTANASKPSKKAAKADTPFQQRLFALCRAIPAGRVSTYGAMAEALNSCARAVGQGMRRNPYAPEVPCHRVIASDLTLGGFSGQWGADSERVRVKRRMLEQEGVTFIGKGQVEAICVLRASDLKPLVVPR